MRRGRARRLEMGADKAARTVVDGAIRILHGALPTALAMDPVALVYVSVVGVNEHALRPEEGGGGDECRTGWRGAKGCAGPR